MSASTRSVSIPSRFVRSPVDKSSNAIDLVDIGVARQTGAQVGADEPCSPGDDDLQRPLPVHQTDGEYGACRDRGPGLGPSHPLRGTGSVSSGRRFGPCSVADAMTRIFLSPPDVGEEERALLLDSFDSNWVAPLGSARRRVRARAGRLRRRGARGGAVERHRGAAPGPVAARRRAGRRGPRADAHLRGHRQRRDLRRRASGVPRRRPGDVVPRSRRWSSTSWPDGLAAAACRPPCCRSTCTASARTTTPSGMRAREFEVPIIEEAAEAVGATYGGQARRLVRDHGGLLVQRQQDHDHLRWRRPVVRPRGVSSSGPATSPRRLVSRPRTTSTRRSGSTTA